MKRSWKKIMEDKGMQQSHTHRREWRFGPAPNRNKIEGKQSKGILMNGNKPTEKAIYTNIKHNREELASHKEYCHQGALFGGSSPPNIQNRLT